MSPFDDVSETQHQVETRALAHSTWQFAGLVDELSAPGAWLRAQLLDRDVFVRRADSGQLRCFDNACAHRRFPLCTTRAGSGRLECGFHGWVYDDDGVPIGIPRNKELFGFDRAKQQSLRLPEHRVQLVGRFVFVATGAAPPLDAFFGGYHSTLTALSTALGPVSRHTEEQLPTCWKHSVARSIEDHRPPAFDGQLLGTDFSSPAELRGVREGLHASVTNTRAAGTIAHQLFPNTRIAVGLTGALVSAHRPVGSAQTRLEHTWLPWKSQPLPVPALSGSDVTAGWYRAVFDSLGGTP